ADLLVGHAEAGVLGPLRPQLALEQLVHDPLAQHLLAGPVAGGGAAPECEEGEPPRVLRDVAALHLGHGGVALPAASAAPAVAGAGRLGAEADDEDRDEDPENQVDEHGPRVSSHHFEHWRSFSVLRLEGAESYPP